MKRRRLLLAAAALPLMARAQTTAKTLRIIVPFPAGGGTDVAARLIADKLRGNYAPAVIVVHEAWGLNGQIKRLVVGAVDGYFSFPVSPAIAVPSKIHSTPNAKFFTDFKGSCYEISTEGEEEFDIRQCKRTANERCGLSPGYISPIEYS